MPAIIVRHTVEDFDTWRPHYEEHAVVRRQYGVSDARVYRDAAAANDVVIVFQVEDLDRAREFVTSDDLRETMERAGVVSAPTVWFLNDV